MLTASFIPADEMNGIAPALCSQWPLPALLPSPAEEGFSGLSGKNGEARYNIIIILHWQHCYQASIDGQKREMLDILSHTRELSQLTF
jgi:hypothetical protein